MKVKYKNVIIRGEKKRLYYYPELTEKRHLPAAIFSRFATFSLEMVTTGNRLHDKFLAKEKVEAMGMNWKELCKGHDIHHHPLCHKLEWIPTDIHRPIPHRGGISIIKHGLEKLTQ